jgi:sulfur relay protein TusB/DsrH
MIVVVKSGPDTTDGRRGVTLARSAGAALVLIQNAVVFAHAGLTGGAGPGAVYALEDDLRLRGLGPKDLDEHIVRIDYPKLVDLVAGADNVVGAF